MSSGDTRARVAANISGASAARANERVTQLQIRVGQLEDRLARLEQRLQGTLDVNELWDGS